MRRCTAVTDRYDGPFRLLGVLSYWGLYERSQMLVAVYHPLRSKVMEVAEYEITERYVRRLEAMICAHPGLWMWSHRRWKHKRTNANR